MEKKLEKKPQEKKQKKNSTEVERYVDRALTWAGIDGANSRRIEAYITFDDFPYVDGIDVESVSKKMNEVSVYNAVKNSKHLKAAVDRIVKKLATDLVDTTIDAQEQIKQDKIYEEKQRKQQEDYEKKNAAKIAAAAAKQAIAAAKKEEAENKAKAQKAIFREGLTASQKRAIKKFYGLDIENK